MLKAVPQSEKYFARAKLVSPGGVHSPVRSFRGVGGTPRFIREARGCELIDEDGNSYIDFCMSWGPMLFGHQDPEIKEAVFEAMGRGWSYGTAEKTSLELAELMASSIPWAEQIRFVNSGTEAVMSALRVARAATGRTKILKFDGCYHGHVDSMLVRAGSGLADMASPDSAGVSANVAGETIVASLDDEAALEAVFRKEGSSLAAAIVEPLPANNGLLVQNHSFLKKLAALCKQSGTLLIFDEVISGFRVAFGGMAEVTGIQPDLVTYGKVIGGGFPVGAYAGRRDLMEWVAPVGPVYQAGTLSANPVAMAAGLAMLKKIKRENPFEKLSQTTAKLVNSLSQIAASSGLPVSTHTQLHSSLFWSVFGKVHSSDGQVRSISQVPQEQREIYSQIFHGMLDRGVYLAPSGYEVSFLSTAHQPQHLDRVVSAFEETLKEVSRR